VGVAFERFDPGPGHESNPRLASIREIKYRDMVLARQGPRITR
jgi:hypothetical protein